MSELMRMLILVEMISLLPPVLLQFELTRMLPKGSENSSACKADGANISDPARETTNNQEEPREEDLQDVLDGNAEQFPVPSDEPYCRQEGESAPPDRQVSPEKLYRAALLRSRFADIIIKARENTTEKGMDSERLKLEEELGRTKKRRESTTPSRGQSFRRAARQALHLMVKTVDINENSQCMEDLEMFRAGPDEHVQSFIDEASADSSQNGLGSFKFPANSNPLEKLGLYMKNDDDEEEEVQPESIEHKPNDTEEGEIY
ncbi:transcription factor GTE10-like [Salvia divinorum]|uniref:Transcription factor GTE10-like n=1 Tax=Salvia divinorum TaxID=28513 RepID=A0ABD1I6R4_SALDI